MFVFKLATLTFWMGYLAIWLCCKEKETGDSSYGVPGGFAMVCWIIELVMVTFILGSSSRVSVIVLHGAEISDLPLLHSVAFFGLPATVYMFGCIVGKIVTTHIQETWDLLLVFEFVGYLTAYLMVVLVFRNARQLCACLKHAACRCCEAYLNNDLRLQYVAWRKVCFISSPLRRGCSRKNLDGKDFGEVIRPIENAVLPKLLVRRRQLISARKRVEKIARKVEISPRAPSQRVREFVEARRVRVQKNLKALEKQLEWVQSMIIEVQEALSNLAADLTTLDSATIGLVIRDNDAMQIFEQIVVKISVSLTKRVNEQDKIIESLLEEAFLD